MTNSNKTETRQIRRFGVCAFVFSGCLCGVGFSFNKPVPTYLFGFISLIGFGLLMLPSSLKQVYFTWLKGAHFVGRLMSMLALALVYYLVITPAALVKRLFGGPPIRTKLDREATSYWVSRTDPAQPNERFYKRF